MGAPKTVSAAWFRRIDQPVQAKAVFHRQQDSPSPNAGFIGHCAAFSGRGLDDVGGHFAGGAAQALASSAGASRRAP